MKRNCRTLLAVAVAVTALSATAWAQAKPDAKPADTTPAAKPAATTPAAAKPAATKPETAEKPKIQMAILLDTSNSMDGLIGQARAQLWKIVNEFAKAKKGGVQPDLEVALYEYGNNGLDAKTHWIRMVSPFTDDLDKVSDELFKLKTNGGEEYCGAVITRATKDLKWAESDKVFKCIFIAGNEPFTQGPVDPFKACSDAIKKGITVNTIHCGPLQVGINEGWQKGAQLADGSYVAIDQDKPTVAIKTPVDAKIVKLGEELNKTYVFYGKEEDRKGRAELQQAQDANAAKASPAAAAGRAVTKGGELYNNSKFDLVDGVEKKEVKLEDLKDEELPAEMKGKSVEEKKAIVESNAKKRKEIQAEIQKLNIEREKFIAAEQAKQKNKSKTESLDTAVIRSVREQAAKKDFKFGK
jgi:hypothetical protein